MLISILPSSISWSILGEHHGSGHGTGFLSSVVHGGAECGHGRFTNGGPAGTNEMIFV